MGANCAAALKMPSNYVVMDVEEMTYTEGGISISVSQNMLNKGECSKLGDVYGPQIGLTADAVAKEIYAHAVLYYTSSTALVAMSHNIGIGVGIGTDLAIEAGLRYIKKHANPIDLGGDSAFRVAIFEAIWKMY